MWWLVWGNWASVWGRWEAQLESSKGTRARRACPAGQGEIGGWDAFENKVRERAVAGRVLPVRRPGLGPGERGQGVDSAPQAGWLRG